MINHIKLIDSLKNLIGWEILNGAERGNRYNASISFIVIWVINRDGGWEERLDGGDKVCLTLNGDGLGKVIDVNRKGFGSAGTDWTGKDE